MDMDTTSVGDVTTVGSTMVGRTTGITNRFYRPEAPSTILDMDANGDLDDLHDELEMRQAQFDELKKSKSDALRKYRESEKKYKDFRDLSDQYMEADKVRNPDPEQTAIIQTLETSVSTIVLTGGDAAGTPRQQTANRIVKKLAELNDRQTKDRKQWDQYCSDYDSCAAALKAAKARNGGASQPIVDGRIMYCPFRGGSMERSSRDVIVEIWSSICGPQMLEMRFDRLSNSVRELRKSLSAEVRANRSGISIKYDILLTLV